MAHRAWLRRADAVRAADASPVRVADAGPPATGAFPRDDYRGGPFGFRRARPRGRGRPYRADGGPLRAFAGGGGGGHRRRLFCEN